MTSSAVLSVVAATFVAAAAAHAGTVVAPNAYAGAPGYEYQALIFGNGSTSAATFQEGFAASQFAGLATGTRITGIGYRLPTTLPTVTDAVDYLDFTVRIGTATVPIASLSSSASANEGADTVAARTGAFTLPGGALVNTGGANPFYTIAFATPYVYRGGDLLLTTSYSVAGAVPFIGVDAVDAFDAVNTLAGTDPAFVRTHFYNAPIVEFTTGAVPEPAAWLLLIAGFGLTGVAARRRAGAAA